ncbi:16152_t:CDS:2 [Gigaspora margarita]|uniref:16152_t:CDS:1 n=1 Tax=Gigaspora margarita TaxID=4874 RepID=A0ABN7UTD1_GIGMA|nr:16152_t:CDS:2 [Gigaspora margarita]
MRLLMKKVLNLTIETGRTEELYKIHQKLIADIKQQLAEPEKNIIQSDDENYYTLINNPPISQMKG